jgi:murein DD-endopeptidase MepM/ murein hydrolase activator NlpD
MKQYFDLPMQQRSKKKISIFVFSLFFFFSYILTGVARADLADTIKSKIESKNSEIKKLEEEIKKYEASLNKTGEQAKSLKNELDNLNSSKKKLETELSLTQKNLDKTAGTIGVLATKITKTKSDIINKKFALVSSLRDIRDVDQISPVESMLSSKSLNEVSEYMEQIEKVNKSFSDIVHELELLNANLSGQKSEQEIKKTELSKLKNNLSGQKKAVLDTVSEKDKLLKVTKNQESNYKKILEEKIRLREEFEKELFKFESELKIAVDPSKLPTKKSGVLAWPLANVLLTQQFGKTGSSGRLYASGTHNGIDLRAADGTKVFASLSGTVQATGNTDAKTNCYSYGKWILIKHTNGLSTLYAHLSSISVNAGDKVATGDIIGYSGHTGYVTGPHLHLTVLASEGVKVMPIPTATNCGGVIIPIGTPQAFLDPLLYL